MSNTKEHIRVGIPIGIATAGLLNLYSQLERKRENSEEKFIFHEFFLSLVCGAGIGYIGSQLPDLIEPATNRMHRKFFHSIAFGTLITGVGVSILFNKNINTENKIVGLSFITATLSHLYKDNNTFPLSLI